MLCKITGKIYLIDGSPAANRRIEIRAAKMGVYPANGGGLITDVFSIETDGVGNVNFDMVPGQYFISAVYREGVDPIGRDIVLGGVLAVPDQATADIFDILMSSLPPPGQGGTGFVGKGWSRVYYDPETDDLVFESDTYPELNYRTPALAGPRQAAQDWAEGSGEPGGPGTKSAKTWALEAGVSSDIAQASAAQAAIYNNGPILDSVSALAADTSLTYDESGVQVLPGQTIHTREGFAYLILPQGSVDYDWATLGGVLVYLLPSDAGHYNFAGMNPAADGVTDDFPKLRRLLDRPSFQGTSAPYQWQVAIFIPPGKYYISQTIELKKSVKLFGNQGGRTATGATTLVFPSDTVGIIVHRADTIGDTIDNPSTTSAENSIIEGLMLVSTRGASRDAHGIRLRATATVRHVSIREFGGDGIHIRATSSTTDDSLKGNANHWFLEAVRIFGVGGNGVYVRGSDVNAGTAIGVNTTSCGRNGIWDYSFLGNTYIGCHTALCGLAGIGGNAADQSSMVSYGGNRYCAHWNATETQLVGTIPGTDPAVWIPRGIGEPTSRFPEWTSGKPVGTYFPAFSYRAESHNARNVFLGCYAEGDGSGSALPSNPTVMIGGLIESLLVGNRITGGSLRLDFTPWRIRDGAVRIHMGHPNVDGTVMSWTHEDDDPTVDFYHFRRNGADWRVDFRKRDNETVYGITGVNTELTMGTSTPIPHVAYFPSLGIGSGSNIRRITNGTPSAPSSGEYARGDIIFIRNATTSGAVGWVCTTAGTAGSTAVFREFGATS